MACLLDDVKDLPSNNWGRYIDADFIRDIKITARQARPYIFDRDASYKLGKFIRDCPDIIADNLEFAIPPYPHCYIEVEIDAVHEAIGNLTTKTGPEADWKLGFISNGDLNTIYTVACNRVKKDCMVNIFGYARPKDKTPFEEYYKGRSDKELDRLLMGSFALLLGSSLTKLTSEQATKFTDTFFPSLMAETPSEVTAELSAAAAGEIRVYVAALLMLHQKRCVSVGEKPWERRMSRGKSRVFMAHSTVTIVVDGPVEMRRSFSITDRQGPRAHEVPAHYCHRYGERVCEHVWIKRENEENHWDCPKCGRFRYLRKEHMRGDASKGYVRRDYKVTTQYAKEMEECEGE